nr:RNA-directed DNA polymerase, eukaryota [Tanacetum cinerariifolium]
MSQVDQRILHDDDETMSYGHDVHIPLIEYEFSGDSSGDDESVVSDHESVVTGNRVESVIKSVNGLVKLGEDDKLHGIIVNKFVAKLGEIGVKADVECVYRNMFGSSLVSQAKMSSFRIYVKAVGAKNGREDKVKCGWFGGCLKQEIDRIVGFSFGYGDVGNCEGFRNAVVLNAYHSPFESMESTIVDDDGGEAHIALSCFIGGDGNDKIMCKRSGIINNLNDLSNIQTMEVTQKTKIRWAIEGDENSSFFHGMLNKKQTTLNVRGVLVDGSWIDNPIDVKDEFLNHFSTRFQNPDPKEAYVKMDFPNVLSQEDRQFIEREVSIDEIKKAVWDCGTDKAPGPDGFTFSFYQRYWDLIHGDVTNAVRYFFTHCDIPHGCNLSFIALIPKNQNAKLVKDFRPISVI